MKLGVKHVIFVERTKSILDYVACEFTKRFYELIKDGKHSICEAFHEAKRLAQMKDGSEGSFVRIIPDHKKKENNLEDCSHMHF